MSSLRSAAIETGLDYFDSGAFLENLSEKVSFETESQNPDRQGVMLDYFREIMIPAFEEMGFTWRILDNPVNENMPFLYVERIEEEKLTTVLGYGHGDVVLGMEGKWRAGRSPWKIEQDGDYIYGRGTADNKGQHAINIAALGLVLKSKGRLGFNVKYLIESAEEIGSPGLRELCQQNKSLLKADLLIASDGPRQQAAKPTIYLGSRGNRSFDLKVKLREGAHHSGNWGGVISDAGTILAQAIASIIDRNGAIRVAGWRPDGIPEDVQAALAKVIFETSEEDGPEIEPGWGEPGLTAAEKLFAWTSFAVLAFETGNPARPVGAIPATAWARCGLRFPPGLDICDWTSALRRHLDENGFSDVVVEPQSMGGFDATRTALDNPWVRLACKSLEDTTGAPPVLLPNLGGSLPNGCFMDVLGLPTIWVPHSYPGCSQHAPNEHILASVARQALGIMVGLYWDIGEARGAVARADDR
ncbi:MAG: M20 peptidase family dipeptidase [Alphaproteobacteria bacterium]|nr:MAG: M20 peptidase family dipeptidase [Alphaproteobacteria bacterium]